jgi:hypothetical protein
MSRSSILREALTEIRYVLWCYRVVRRYARSERKRLSRTHRATRADYEDLNYRIRRLTDMHRYVLEDEDWT